jgi:hypothetical protein
MEIGFLDVAPTAEAIAELDRLGHQIAELSAHLEAATARLLDLFREFDARGGWNHGFSSCAHWLAWRGRLLPDVPAPPAIPDDPVQSLRARNEAEGLCLDAQRLCSTALWEPLDVGWAIDVLHPRALQPLMIGE